MSQVDKRKERSARRKKQEVYIAPYSIDPHNPNAFLCRIDEKDYEVKAS